MILAHYDIIDLLIYKYLNINDSKSLLQVNKHLYTQFYNTNRFFYIFINKYINYFNSLHNIKEHLEYNNNNYHILNHLYNTHHTRNITLPIILKYIAYYQYKHQNNNFDKLFSNIISQCYFSKSSLDNSFNLIHSNELLYLLQYSKNNTLKIITQHLHGSIDAEIIYYAIINLKPIQSEFDNISLLLKYLLYKHFFRYSSYIEYILTNIILHFIQTSNITSINFLLECNKIYKFQLYKHLLDSNYNFQNKHINILLNNFVLKITE